LDKRHPYVGLQDYRFWGNDADSTAPGAFDPVTAVSFTIGRKDPVVTAGSCFAQHVSRSLKEAGFTFLVTEQAHPMIPDGIARNFGYGVFTARYGNLYTARQLKQLLLRAFGRFEPAAEAWIGKGDRLVDPFRPQIHPNGYVSLEELRHDRQTHLGAVRQAVETLSVFVFTLGLTEAWADSRDGAVFPLAPGVAGGVYEASAVTYHNFSVAEVIEDVQWSIDFIRKKNPDAKFIFTVSPVPLNATYEDRHVVVASTYSKSVLRVAAEAVCAANPLCDYFPSYEIITSSRAKRAYFESNRRNVAQAGVDRVMEIFLKHYGDQGPPEAQEKPEAEPKEAQSAHLDNMEKMVELLCDEESISNR